MAHSFTGHRTIDCARVIDLCEFALQVSKVYLKPGGRFICKYFNGPGSIEMIQDFKSEFTRTVLEKPKASRKESAECYFIGFGFRPRS